MKGEPDASSPSAPLAQFSEREFYAREFRGRTLAIALPGAGKRGAGKGDAGEDMAPLLRTVEALRGVAARALLISAEPGQAADALGVPALDLAEPRLEAEVWRALRSRGCALVGVGQAADFHAASRELAVRLGIFKLVWIDRAGGLGGPGRERRSFVQQAELREAVGAAGDSRAALWTEVRSALDAGVASVNVCALEGLEAELFTYSGSGTLFTRERYIEVRRLSVDDYDAAHDLVQRGVAEGYLAPRSQEQLDEILAHGFGAFVEHAHLAGIGALIERWGPAVGEIACLYTLTRFLGEGVGGYLVAFALERAREREMRRVFACTTQDRVGAFFERQGFGRTTPDSIPAARWAGYAPERRARVLCYDRSP
jgi:amino-acid N-acetyltransferase